MQLESSVGMVIYGHDTTMTSYPKIVSNIRLIQRGVLSPCRSGAVPP
jgi:hypothetical protein